MNGDVRISYSELTDWVEEVVGIGQWIDLGPTGRRFKTTIFDREVVSEERAEFQLDDVANACGILSDDDFDTAARDGIRKYLHENAAAFKAKLIAKAEEMKAEMLAAPLEGQLPEPPTIGHPVTPNPGSYWDRATKGEAN